MSVALEYRRTGSYDYSLLISVVVSVILGEYFVRSSVYYVRGEKKLYG